MTSYNVVSDYAGVVNGRAHVRWKAGSQVDVTGADADWVNRDAPGTLVAPAARATEAPKPTLPDPGRVAPGRRAKRGGSGGA